MIDEYTQAKLLGISEGFATHVPSADSGQVLIRIGNQELVYQNVYDINVKYSNTERAHITDYLTMCTHHLIQSQNAHAH
jgi:hypothetical protein